MVDRTSCRVTLRELMILASLPCLALALLRHALIYWGPDDVTALALTILVATNVLVWFQGARRVVWAGFGVFGWAYLVIALASPAAEHLPTTQLFDEFYEREYPAPPPAGPNLFLDAALAQRAKADRFTRASHSVLSLAFAVLGGIGASLLFPAKKDAGEASPPDGTLLRPGWRGGAG